VSVNTKDDRTLFFDLLPFDLGSVLGYKVALKLYTVPGQVQYDATRRAVLAGADAVVFVADSDRARERDNRSAWDNLVQNMRAARLDPDVVPILTQLNKRDLPEAASQSVVESWLGLPAGRGLPATACEGQGVLETFLGASHAMLERLVARAEPHTRRSLDLGDLRKQLDASFAPYLARRRSGQAVSGAGSAATAPIVLGSSDHLENAAAASVALGARLVDEQGRAARLEREAESLRLLSDALRATGASFDREAIVHAALTASVTTLGAAGAALGTLDVRGEVRLEGAAGDGLSGLIAHGEASALLARMLSAPTVSVVDDLSAELPGGSTPPSGLRALAVVPVERTPRASLVVAMPDPDGAFTDLDVRFLATLSGHLAVGLEKVRIHAELKSHRDRLEEVVAARTRSLRKAYDELKSVEVMKDRFLANVSHEMRSPLTAIIGAASILKDYTPDPAAREEMTDGILRSAEALDRLVDGLLRVARLPAADELAIGEATPAEIVADALRVAGAEARTSVSFDPRVGPCPVDAVRFATALGHLLDNALKFGPPAGAIELRVTPCVLARPGGAIAGVAFAVLDRGPGLAEEDVERAFAPFEQGGDPMTGKPSGVGLGLYEARAIARRHGGTLIYLPRSGGGSEFRISVPAEEAAVTTVRRVRRA
jgi:signal transduction histidine kinase